VACPQERLAEAAGLDRTYVGRIERGEHNLTVLTILALADALDVSGGTLLDSVWDVDLVGGRRPGQARRPSSCGVGVIRRPAS
jgi:transcriptional regulator with XRE-family HTH domain